MLYKSWWLLCIPNAFSRLAQVQNYGQVLIVPVQWCDHSDAISIPHSQRSVKLSNGKNLFISSKIFSYRIFKHFFYKSLG